VQQGPEIVLGLGQWQLFKEEVEIAQRLQAVSLGGLDEAIAGRCKKLFPAILPCR